jgi:hypothetical protein
MLRRSRHRNSTLGEVRRVVTRWVISLAVVAALFDPALEMPAGAAADGGTSTAAVTVASSKQGVSGLLAQAQACHSYFEHHQLVYFENASTDYAPETARACYLTDVIPLPSLNPYPLRRPPRV